MNAMTPEIDEYLKTVKQWQNEMRALRAILLECQLTETLKWKQPCYTFEDHNIVIIGGFKAYCSLGFFKGSLLADRDNLLSKPGDNSQSVRQLRFTNVEEITELRSTIKAYIDEAIEIEKSGLKVDLKERNDITLTEELQDRLDEDPMLKEAFFALTPGRQRGYNLYFSAAKQTKTRIARIEKYREQICDGKGINDCTCGLSKKMPSCDGSHKNIS